MNIISLFPIPLAIIKNENNEKHKKILIEECGKLKKEISNGSTELGSRAYSTEANYNILNNKKFKPINDWVSKHIREYADKIGFKNKKISSEWGWFNFYGKNGYIEAHDHEFHDISAVYYLSTPKDTGKIVFYTHEAKGVKNYFDANNSFTWKTFYVEPEDGMLVIFKANLMHGVTQNKTNKTRVSFAYNYKIK